MAEKAYQHQLSDGADLTTATGQLPVEWLDVTDDFDAPTPSSKEPSIIAVIPNAEWIDDPKLPHWYRFADLMLATAAGSGSGAPVGSLSGGSYSASFVIDDGIFPKQFRDANDDSLTLTIDGGFGRSVISASIPVSVSASTGSRAIRVRLLIDGLPTAWQTVTPSSNNTGGATNTLTFAATTYLLPPVRTHTVRVEVSPTTNGNVLTVYSTGATITVTEAPTQAVGGVGGDLSGTLPNPTVAKIQGRAVSSTAPTSGQYLVWDGSAWTPNSLDLSVKEDKANKGVANGYASLDSGGKVPATQLPSLVVTDTFVVGSEAAQLALSTAQAGDIAIRTDIGTSYVLAGTYSTLADWKQLIGPYDAYGSAAAAQGAAEDYADGLASALDERLDDAESALASLESAVSTKAEADHDHEIAGDVTGASLAATSVVAIQGSAVSASAPALGQSLVWDGLAWTPASPPPTIAWAPVTTADGELVVLDDGSAVVVSFPL